MDSYFSLVNVVAAAIFVMFLNKKYRSHQENKTTASSLSLVSPPTSLPRRKYHVFPSFHGPDVRKVFLSHVLKEFKSKGIEAFVDNDMERSKSIGHELIEAIRGSRIAIVLLSKNYASSTWCLNELVEIIECREKLSQTVMPIFYEVDPTDIKKQTGDFGKVYKKTCKGKTKEDIGRWKHALTEVAQITGHHSTNCDNMDCIFTIFHGGKFNKCGDGTVMYEGGAVIELATPAPTLFQSMPVSLSGQRMWYKLPYEDLSELKVLCQTTGNFGKMCEAALWTKAVEVYMERDEDIADEIGRDEGHENQDEEHFGEQADGNGNNGGEAESETSEAEMVMETKSVSIFFFWVLCVKRRSFSIPFQRRS